MHSDLTKEDVCFVPRMAGDTSCALMFFTSLIFAQLYPSVNENTKACLPTDSSRSFHRTLDFQNPVKQS